jgi:hypothetical protein
MDGHSASSTLDFPRQIPVEIHKNEDISGIVSRICQSLEASSPLIVPVCPHPPEIDVCAKVEGRKEGLEHARIMFIVICPCCMRD